LSRRTEHIYYISQAGDALIQKLQHIAVSLDEEEELTHFDVINSVRIGFDVERVTKRFYDFFKKEHAAFLKLIKGIPDKELQRWYVSVMLNRLMFIYFIQNKGFLDGDPKYLSNKLAANSTKGKDQFYRKFLCPLFFEGFAKTEEHRSAAMNKLLGKVPYLNGGLFLKHQIEKAHGKNIQIPDRAFKKIFDFFDQYQWHLDERPLGNDREINPDVLGYIFEKYINQKQMGAYYTKEDITGYITRNTVIPFLFDAARKKCRIAFEGKQSVWRLLVENPDRYIYPAMRHGITCHVRLDLPGEPPRPLDNPVPLPPEIAAGLDDVSKRTEWNKPAPAEVALPTEIWREVVFRRQRCEEIRAKLASGEVREINELITLNLDIEQFAQDVIETCEGPELLRAFWEAIAGRIPEKSNEKPKQGVTVLDPACGSGAFLFAALNLLESLYEACLDRMEAFLAELEKDGRKKTKKYSDFRTILQRIETHPKRKYFIFKSIAINNLYGVDIMEEAIEICKLRLFLKLVAQVDDVNDIEPLPDIDFNIRAGNTLVGYATYDAVKKAVTSKFDFDNAMGRIQQKAQEVDELFALFRQQQTTLGGTVTAQNKQALQDKLAELDAELDQRLASEGGVDSKKKFTQWQHSHQPFHWFVDFYGIMATGGFDVIIGNPPYLEKRQVHYEPQHLTTGVSKAIHAMFIERAYQCSSETSWASMIVPLAIVCTQRMEVVQRILEQGRNVWYSNYSWRPGKLFDTVNRALTIFVSSSQGDSPQSFSTKYQKWMSSTRSYLIPTITYASIPRDRKSHWAPKLGAATEQAMLQKLLGIKTLVGESIGSGQSRIFHRTTGGLYWKVFTDFAPAFSVNGQAAHSSRETSFGVRNDKHTKPLIAVLSSDLFWWWYTIAGNLRDLNPSDIQKFPLPDGVLDDHEVAKLGAEYIRGIVKNSSMLVRQQKQTGCVETQSFKIQQSKSIIDRIDTCIARHYGLTSEELDFIINYDIKYRMGIDSDGG